MTLSIIQPTLVDDKIQFTVEKPAEEKTEEEIVEEMAKELVEINLQRFFLKKSSEIEKKATGRSYSR